jgi:hypothetical protein
MIFNRIEFVKMMRNINEIVKESPIFSKHFEIISAEKSFNFSENRTKNHYSIQSFYNFENNVMSIKMDGIWNASENIILIYQLYIKETITFFEERNIHCLLSIDSTHKLSNELSNLFSQYEFYDSDIIPIGNKARALVDLVEEIELPIIRMGKKNVLQISPFDYGTLCVNYHIPTSSIKIHYESSEVFDEAADRAYLLYEISSKVDYELFINDVELKKKNVGKIMNQLEEYITKSHPSITHDKNTLGKFYIEPNQYRMISIERNIRDDFLEYLVTGFASEKRFEEIEPVLDFLKEDFERFINIEKAKKEIVSFLIDKDPSSFRFETVGIIPRNIEMYFGLYGKTMELFFQYTPFAKKSYACEVHLAGQFTIKVYANHTEKLSSDVCNELLKKISQMRLDTLFNTNHKGFIPKLYYQYNRLNFTNSSLTSSLSKEKINKIIEQYFQKHPLKVTYFKEYCFVQIDSLYVYKAKDNFYIENDIDKFLKLFGY